MGSPKALLPIAGETFADRLIGIFTPFCEQIVVVLGHDADHIRCGIRRDATYVFNPDHELGQLTSLQSGFRAIPQADCAFFIPVDYPSIRSETVQTLIHSWTKEYSALVPMTDGRRGHPVLIARPLIDEILALPTSASARDVIHRHVATTHYVQTDDPGILRDIDYPSDLLTLQQAAV